MGDDLTRWNRAGRTRFDYVDGNAVAWLERLRAALAARFPNGAFEDDAPEDETVAERLRRLETRYRGETRGDLLWESTRAFARACHVLTAHLDTYANEGYLRTATQWDNARRLVEMIDYHPAPPASASTPLVLEAKGDGEVAAGFQVKYTPPEGGAPVVFETLVAIEVDSALNALRLAGWNRSAVSLAQAPAPVWVPDDEDGLSGGQIALLTRVDDSTQAVVVEIDRIDAQTGELVLEALPDQIASDAWPLADTRLLLRPDRILSVLPADGRALRLDAGHGLVAGDVITWRSGGTWRFDEVLDVADQSLRLTFAAAMPAAGTAIHKAAAMARPSGDDFLFAVSQPGARVARRGAAGFSFVSAADYDEVADNGTDRYFRVSDAAIGALYVAPESAAGATRVGVVRELSSDCYEVLGSPGELASGQWLAAEATDGVWWPLQIERIVEQEDRFFLELAGASPAQLGLERIVCGFRDMLSAQGADRNDTPLTAAERVTLPLLLPAAASARARLAVGRALVIEQAGGVAPPVPTTITKVDGGSITVDPPLPAAGGFTRGNTVIRANVALAGHGERQPERVLGSGDATRSHQIMEFANAGVSFVADAVMAAGVRADVAITVAGQRWTQVSTLNDSGAADAHYRVRMTEDGFLSIGFGDGEHGRRLPTGTGNVRIAWRKGTGLDGNVSVGGLTTPVKPHRLVEAVRQPVAASGGADMEAAESLRDNAPATLLTLERAVSLRDFQHLAVGHSSVWQANAFAVPALSTRDDGIEVVVVPAGGGALGPLAATLETHLRKHALPGVAVRVSDYEPVTVSLDVTVRVRSSAFDPDTVLAAVDAALRSAFGLRQRALGQPLYRAELFEQVEAVVGVENSDCLIAAVDESKVTRPIHRNATGGVIKRLKPSGRQLLHVTASADAITLRWQEYSP